MNKTLLHTMAAGLVLCAAFTSCEMKEELSGEKNSSDIGFLNLGVAVNASQNVITKAEEDAEDGVVDNGEQTGDAVSAADFPVSINGVTDPAYVKSFAHYSELEEVSPIELPVGNYTVTAHSNLDLEPIMSVPFYEGTFTELKVEKDVTAEANVICKMKNTRIKLDYTSDFTANFKTWTITMTDGSANILTFTDKDTDVANPAAKYWLITGEVSQITIDVTATNMDGGTVREKRILTKPEGGNTAYWTGGDALNIQMNGVKPDPENPNGVTGIDISVDVTFSETSEEVEVPVTPGTGGGDDPNPKPDPSEPTITLPQSTYTLPADASANADVVIAAPAGLESASVQIIPDNNGFSVALDAIANLANFKVGVEMVDNSTIATIISAIAPGVVAPAKGDTTYTFPVGSFFKTLSDLGITDGDGHKFVITVKDSSGNPASETLYVKNETEGE